MWWTVKLDDGFGDHYSEIRCSSRLIVRVLYSHTYTVHAHNALMKANFDTT